MNLLDFFCRYQNGDRPLGSRSSTMLLALSLLRSIDKPNIVETGTTRKNIINCPSVEDRAADGSSTLLFADYVNTYGGKVWTCDIEKENIENCKIATEEYKDKITYCVEDSVKFLETFEEKIDFLYLDSVDGNLSWAHEHQLKEIQAAFTKIHNNSIVLLDDLGSKTNSSIPFLEKNNWCQIKINIPHASHYNNFMQGLFVHESYLYTNHANIPIEKRYTWPK
jgi:hypothetical protein